MSSQLPIDNELRTLVEFGPDKIFVLNHVLHASLVLNDLLLKDVFICQVWLYLTWVVVSQVHIFVSELFLLLIIVFMMLLFVVVIVHPLILEISSREHFTSASTSLLGHLELCRLTIASFILEVSITSLM